MELVELEEKTVVGKSVRTCNVDEFSGAGKIPQLWNLFQSEVFGKKLPISAPMGVYHQYESDHNGMYNILAGVESNKKVEGLETVVIPKGKYLMFLAEGPVPISVVTTWQKIWAYFTQTGVAYTRSYAADFELYLSPTEVEIYISIK